MSTNPDDYAFIPNVMEIAPGVRGHSGYYAIERTHAPAWAESSLMLGITALADAGSMSAEDKDEVLLALIATLEVCAEAARRPGRRGIRARRGSARPD